MGLKLELKQTQKMSPQQVQSLEILQMGTQELQAHVEQALLENPTLEFEPPERTQTHSELLQKLNWIAASDRQNHWYHQEDIRNLVEYAATSDETNLYDHLRQQIDLRTLSPRLRLAVDCVLAGLNGNGYLEETPEELSSRCRQSASLVLRAESIVRTLEPAGVGARSLSDCLVLQLERSGESELSIMIAKYYLEDLAQNHYGQIAKKTGATPSEIRRACDTIRSLNPKPGAQFAPREAPGYIIPDLLVTEDNGTVSVTLGDDFLPVLKISAYYQTLLRGTSDAEVRSYLNEKVQQSANMIKCIEQRRKTLLSCARVIVSKQADFLCHGAGKLQPLILSDVAREVGMHESTVSRAIKAKYLQCARGTFPLSHFFGRSVQSAEGDISIDRVKGIIGALIESEDKKRPLSDQKLCDILMEQQIYLSRRTVAKYREEIGLPSSAGRKQY